MSQWKFAPRARIDLVGIRQYSFDNWGYDRAKVYIEQINAAVAAVSRIPARGVLCDKVRTGYSRVRSGSHHIYYRVEPYGILVVRILHENMDVQRHL